MTRLCDIPPAHRWVESVQPGFLFGETDEMRCPDDGVWTDARALAAWLMHKNSNAVGFRRFVYDPEKGRRNLDPGWVYYRGTVIPKEDVLSGKAERDDPRFKATETLKANVKYNGWDCLWIATNRTAWPFRRDQDVFVCVCVCGHKGRRRQMKETIPCYADLDEFWVIGDFVAQAFMGWGGECHQCYIDFGDPSSAERFSTYREAQEFMKSDEDAVEWVKEHGGLKFTKPLRCRKSVTVYPPGVRP